MLFSILLFTGPEMAPRPSQEGSGGGSWAALGGSWALLGRSWRPSWDHPITRSKTRSLRANGGQGLGSILAPKMGPKTTPRRPQNESKIKTKNASLFYRSWTRLGPVLRRSWPCFGVIFGQKTLENVMFRENQRFRKKTASRRIFDATSADVGSQKATKRSPI